MGTCDLCDEPVVGATRHRECLLREGLGGIGHLLAHHYFCTTRHDPDAGVSYRLSALLVDAYVSYVGPEEAASHSFVSPNDASAGPPPPGIHPDRLARLAGLAEGWDGGTAPPIGEGALHAARGLDTVPTCNGGVQFEWHTEHLEIEVEVSADGVLRSFSAEDGR